MPTLPSGVAEVGTGSCTESVREGSLPEIVSEPGVVEVWVPVGFPISCGDVVKDVCHAFDRYLLSGNVEVVERRHAPRKLLTSFCDHSG